MDLTEMNRALRDLHATIADRQRYRTFAETSGRDNTVLLYQIDREIRDLQTDAKTLQGMIDGLNSSEAKL
jgi:hypothetical protein